MGLPAGKSLRGLFTALALAAGASVVAVSPAAAYYSFGTGSSSDGKTRHYNLHLKDESGEQMDFSLPMPDSDREGFRGGAIAVLKDYILNKNMALSDRDASGFVWMIERLAQDAGMGKDEFIGAIGLKPETFQEYEYQKYRNGVMEDYNSVLEAARPNDWNFPDYGLTFGDRKIEEINRKVAEAAARYPEDPAYRVRPLTAEDLRNIRVHIAKTYVHTGLGLIGVLDRKDPGAAGFIQSVDDIVTVLYRIIGKDPKEAQYDGDMVAANNYNRELPTLMDAELARQGCIGQCRDDFYIRLVQFRNFHDRTDFIDPRPPETGVRQGKQPVPQP